MDELDDDEEVVVTVVGVSGLKLAGVGAANGGRVSSENDGLTFVLVVLFSCWFAEAKTGAVTTEFNDESCELDIPTTGFDKGAPPNPAPTTGSAGLGSVGFGNELLTERESSDITLL